MGYTMAEDQVIVYSEEPVDDIWLRLLRFTHQRGLAQHRPRASGQALDLDACAEVTGSCRQAHEYFKAATSSTLATAPLQLYYGMISLLKAATILVAGHCGDIGHHGMTIGKIVKEMRIGDVSLTVQGQRAGGLLEYAQVVQPGNGLTGKQLWTLRELLGSVPDLFDEHAAAYGPGQEIYSVPFERVVLSDSQSADRIDSAHGPTILPLISQIEGFSSRYLAPQQLPDGLVILRPRLKSPGDLAQMALSGRRFLLVGHKKNQACVTLVPMLSIFMGMFILGTLSRYHARRWFDFLGNTQDDERNLIESFVRLSIRGFPNMVLDFVSGRKHIFTGLRFQDTDLREFAVTKDVKEMVSKELSGAIRRLRRQE